MNQKQTLTLLLLVSVLVAQLVDVFIGDGARVRDSELQRVTLLSLPDVGATLTCQHARPWSPPAPLTALMLLCLALTGAHNGRRPQRGA